MCTHTHIYTYVNVGVCVHICVYMCVSVRAVEKYELCGRVAKYTRAGRLRLQCPSGSFQLSWDFPSQCTARFLYSPYRLVLELFRPAIFFSFMVLKCIRHPDKRSSDNHYLLSSQNIHFLQHVLKFCHLTMCIKFLLKPDRSSHLFIQRG